MRGSPIKNFICVIALLLAMAAAVKVLTRNVAAPVAAEKKSTHPKEGPMIEVDVRMTFSHPPRSAKIEGFRIHQKSPGNEMEFTLTLPKGKATELPLDIVWPEQEDARYFTSIIIRQNGKEDDVVTFTNQYSEFSDTFTIDTR